MSKIVLEHETGAFNIKINDTIINTEKDLDTAIEVFKKVVKNNGMSQILGWEEIEESLKSFDDVTVNSDFKTINYRSLKYFYNTGQVFYVAKGNMYALVGGFDTLKHIIEIMENETIQDEQLLVELCLYVGTHHATYSLSGQAVSIVYAAFSYGSVSYNFRTGKMDKGTNSEKASFEDFRNYVHSVIK